MSWHYVGVLELLLGTSLTIENESSLELSDKIKLLVLAWRVNEERFRTAHRLVTV
jgi:hypothetical protein